MASTWGDSNVNKASDSVTSLLDLGWRLDHRLGEEWGEGEGGSRKQLKWRSRANTAVIFANYI